MNAARHTGHPFPLSLANIGERLRIVTFEPGTGMHRRLGSLGLPPGSEIEVLHRQGGGSVVVSRNRARVALGAAMVGKVMVARVEDAA